MGSSQKKIPFHRHREAEEARKKREEDEAARVYAEFVESFNADSTPGSKAFVRGGVVDPNEKLKADSEGGKSRDGASVPKKGSRYVPSFLPPASQGRDAEKKKEEEKPREKEKGKQRSIDKFLEELKFEQELREKHNQEREPWREGRHNDNKAPPSRFDELPDDSDPSGKFPGSFDDGDLQTTNLYVGNLSPKVDENFLLRTFGRFGPIASVKIMWPRTEEERRRQRNCGFVAFMSRTDAQAAKDEMQGVVVYEYELKLGWGKSVALPAQALPAPPPGHMAIRNIEGRTVILSGPDGAAITSVTNQNSELVLTPNVPDIVVVPPADDHLRHVMDTMALYVLDGGCTFEQAVMERGRGNPLFDFLFDLSSKEHTYYVWRLYSFAQIVEVLTESLTLKETPIPTKVARLMLVSDILHNSSAPVKNSSAYRTKFEATLPDIMESFNDLHRSITGRITAEALKERVLKVLQVWADWFLFSDAYLSGLRATFLRSSNSGVISFHLICGDVPEVENKTSHEDATIDGGKLNQDGALSMGREAAMKELLCLPIAELERRCRHNGLSLCGGREMMVARLLSLEEAEREKGYEQDDDLTNGQSYSYKYPRDEGGWNAHDAGRREPNLDTALLGPTGSNQYGNKVIGGHGKDSVSPEQEAVTNKKGKSDPVLLVSKWSREDDGSDDEDKRSPPGLGLSYSSGSEDAGHLGKAAELDFTTDAIIHAYPDNVMNEEYRQKLRRLEVAVMEYRESLEEQGCRSKDEIEKKVVIHRRRLQSEFGLSDSTADSGSNRHPFERISMERKERHGPGDTAKKRCRSHSRSRSPQRKSSDRDRDRHRDRDRSHESWREWSREKSGSREDHHHDKDRTTERDKDRRKKAK